MQEGNHGRLFQAPDSWWASKDVPKAVRAKRQEIMSTIFYLQSLMSEGAAGETYNWARDADLRYEDDPSILIQCGRCKGPPRRDPAPSYARNGSGYILRKGNCNDCTSSGKEDTRTIFYPTDPRIPRIRMRRLKTLYMRSHPELKTAETDCEDSEDLTDEERDEAKELYRDSVFRIRDVQICKMQIGKRSNRKLALRNSEATFERDFSQMI